MQAYAGYHLIRASLLAAALASPSVGTTQFQSFLSHTNQLAVPWGHTNQETSNLSPGPRRFGGGPRTGEAPWFAITPDAAFALSGNYEHDALALSPIGHGNSPAIDPPAPAPRPVFRGPGDPGALWRPDLEPAIGRPALPGRGPLSGAVPAPGALTLLGVAALVLGHRRRRRVAEPCSERSRPR